MSHAQVDEHTAEALMSYDDGRGDYVTVALSGDESAPRTRIGVARELPVHKDDFADVLMIPWPHKERPEVVELRAYIAGLRWLLRSVKHIGKRQIFLLDSRVVLGAARKGPSASPALINLMKKLSALLMLSGTLPHCLYIPTEFNPADAPSRGLRRHTKRGKVPNVRARHLSGDGIRQIYFPRHRHTISCLVFFIFSLLGGWTSQAGDVFFVDDGAKLSGCKLFAFDCDSIVH